MPNIAAAGTYTKDTAGFGSLKASPSPRQLLFAGTSEGTACTVQYTDDGGTDRVFANGTIDTLPTSLKVEANIDIKVVVTGTPDFNLTVTQ